MFRYSKRFRDAASGLFSLHPGLTQLLHWAVYAVASGVFVFAGLLAIVRFWLVPHIQNYRPEIVSAVSHAIGERVEIRTLDAAWDGWNPTLIISDVQIFDNSGKVVLTLPKVSNSVSWKSLFFLDLRLRELAIDRPELQVQRDDKGLLRVAGITIDQKEQNADTGLSDWLLRQRHVVVRDALVLWQDQLRGTPQLILDHVNFELDNSHGRHRFGLSAVPPGEFSGPIDFRGNIRGQSFNALQQLSGQLYLKLDYADLAAWREWLPLPILIRSGAGALRLWVDVEAATPVKMVADLQLRDLNSRLRDDLPELELANLQGRVSWHHTSDLLEISGERLSLAAQNGVRVEPTDFSLKLFWLKGREAGGDFSVNHLPFDPMRALVAYLPLESAWREQLRALSPHGALEAAKLSWQGEMAHPQTFSFQTHFTNFGIDAAKGTPGIANLSGELDMTNERGTVSVASKNLTITALDLFEQPLSFDILAGGASWRNDAEGLKVKLGTTRFSNAHAAGTLAGEYRLRRDKSRWIDLSGGLSRADGTHVIDYLPLTLGTDPRAWVRRAVQAGSSTDVRFKARGELSSFPFVDDKDGLFEVNAKINDATLDFAPGWPKLEHIRGELKFHGQRIDVNSDQGTTLGTQLAKVNVSIPDVAHGRILVQGEVNGPTNEFLRYIEQSPVQDMIDKGTEGMSAQGNGRLSLKLDLPLSKLAASKIDGEFQFLDDRLFWNDAAPPLDHLNGKVRFTEATLGSTGLSGQIFGGPVNLALANQGKKTQITGQGNADLSTLRNFYVTPVARHVSGHSEWTLNVEMGSAASNWSVESPLKGAVIDLPAPFSKAAGDSAPFRLTQSMRDKQRDLVIASYDRVAELRVARRDGTKLGDKSVVEGAALTFGPASQDTIPRPGLWLEGKLDQLDLDRWSALKPWQWMAGDGQSGGGLPAAGATLHINRLIASGRQIDDLDIDVATQEQNIRAQLQSAAVSGTITWIAASPTAHDGKIVARLQHLTISDSNGNKIPVKSGDKSPNPGWPAVDLAADTLVSHGRDLGKLELLAHPDGSDWTIDKLVLTNPDGALLASGQWHHDGQGESTRLNGSIEVKDANGYLGRFGYPNAIIGAPSTLKGGLFWQGSPHDFDYPTLNGSVSLQTKKGQFTKIDPGLGKLLGVLNLQSLGRRLALDFRDVFSQGFAFDEISGAVVIHNGVMSTDELRIVGPAARVTLAGTADLAAETQDVQVKVVPTLSAGVSLGVAAATLNPLTGLGALLVQQVLKDPIERMFAFQYHVTGTWSSPQIEKKKSAVLPARATVE